MLTDLDLDNIEKAAQGNVVEGLPSFIHKSDTLKLVAEVRRLRRELALKEDTGHTQLLLDPAVVREAREQLRKWTKIVDALL